MTSNDFYIYLKSDASVDLYPDNKQDSFKVRLREPICLSGNWVCGLQQIQGVFDFDNVDDGRFFFADETGLWHHLTIKAGRYDTIEQLLSAIQECMDSVSPGAILITYNSINGRVSVELTDDSAIIFKGDLSWILGFENGKIISNSVSTVAKRCIDLLVDYHHLMLYTDLIQPQLVGNHSSELLRILDLKTIDGHNHISEFIRPYYFPVKRNNFQIVEIFIRRESGRVPIFKKGKLNLVLHMKRKNFLL